MARLRVLSEADVVAILKRHGFSELRQRGSHLSMQRREGAATVTVVVPLHRELRTGTLLSIIRQSKLELADGVPTAPQVGSQLSVLPVRSDQLQVVPISKPSEKIFASLTQ